MDMKLPPKFKAKWLKALRSGEYKQTNGTLYDNGKHCCLGVACEVVGYNKPVGATIGSQYNKVPPILRNDGELDYVVDALVALNDGMLSSQNPYLKHRTTRSKRSFKQIANFIEKNL